MMLPRPLVILALLVALGMLLAPLSTSLGTADGATVTEVSGAAGADTSSASHKDGGHKSGGLVDATSVFFGCAVGTAVGALVTALPPLVGWTFYAGALPAVVALIATSSIGCTVGLFGGVILSTFHWLSATIGQAWSAVFG